MKSGITGWAQVNGLRGQTSIADRVEWDNYYIQNWSLRLDLRILALTVAEVLRFRASANSEVVERRHSGHCRPSEGADTGRGGARVGRRAVWRRAPWQLQRAAGRAARRPGSRPPRGRGASPRARPARAPHPSARALPAPRAPAPASTSAYAPSPARAARLSRRGRSERGARGQHDRGRDQVRAAHGVRMPQRGLLPVLSVLKILPPQRSERVARRVPRRHRGEADQPLAASQEAPGHLRILVAQPALVPPSVLRATSRVPRLLRTPLSRARTPRRRGRPPPHLREPPRPSGVLRASATARDTGPLPVATGGPLTHRVSPCCSRSTPSATYSGGYSVCASIRATHRPRAWRAQR